MTNTGDRCSTKWAAFSELRGINHDRKANLRTDPHRDHWRLVADQPRSDRGFGQVKDVVFNLKVHKVKTTATTTVTVAVKHSPDGDQNMATSQSTPINQTVNAEPVLFIGDTDSATNGAISEYLHIDIGVGGGAGEWAVVELLLVNKPV